MNKFVNQVENLINENKECYLEVYGGKADIHEEPDLSSPIKYVIYSNVLLKAKQVIYTDSNIPYAKLDEGWICLNNCHLKISKNNY